MELDSIYEGLYEYYVNDYIVFENILKRDYLEITGVLTEADNRNFLQKFWDKIIQLIETMKQKISILIDKVTIKIDQNKIKSLTKMLNNNKKMNCSCTLSLGLASDLCQDNHNQGRISYSFFASYIMQINNHAPLKNPKNRQCYMQYFCLSF